jgi:hypothetical protein
MTVWHVLFFVAGAAVTVWSMSYMQLKSRAAVGRRTDSTEADVSKPARRRRLIEKKLIKPRAWLASTRRVVRLRARAFRKKRSSKRRALWRPLRCPKLPTNRVLINTFKRKRTQPLG